MIKFIVDTQLPPRLASFLKGKGYDAIHTSYFPDGHLLNDRQIIEIAKLENRIIVSKDNDMLDNYLIKGCPPPVLLLQFGNIKNSELILFFELNLTILVEMFEEGAELILFDKNKIAEY